MKNYPITFRSAVVLLTLLITQQGVKAYTITRFDQSWCVSSFPTSYVSGTFSIIETTAAEFTKNQSNRTMFIDLPAGFQFNTTGGTYSVTGTSANDITAISISAITTSRITIRMSISNTAKEVSRDK